MTDIPLTRQGLIETLTHVEKLLNGLTSWVRAKQEPLTIDDLKVVTVYPLHMMGLLPHFDLTVEVSDWVPSGLIDARGTNIWTDQSTITLLVNPSDTEYDMTGEDPRNKLRWSLTLSTIFDALSHELIHVYQNLRRRERGVTSYQRNPSVREVACIGYEDEDENGLYLCKPDEVDAYAYNAASQIYRQCRSLAESIDFLRRRDKDKWIETLAFFFKHIRRDSSLAHRFWTKVTRYLVDKYQ